jgi:catechol 2,3-dioxygenase-like lactoylglutathione lyase family enzyme
MPAITGVAHVELSVSQLAPSVAWYMTLLDAREVFRATSEENRISAVALLEPTSRMVIAFTEHREQEGGRFTPHRVGLDHLCFGVASAEELEAWRAKMDELGIAHGPTRDYGYGLAITCDDPDGIALEFLYSLPRAGPA